MTINPPNKNGRRGILLPRWAIPPVWAVLVLVLQVLLPWVVSLYGPRIGWSPPAPGVWNSLGLVAVAAGIGAYTWSLTFHYRSYRTSVRAGFTPPHLVEDGPYRFSRNPMYAAGLFAWLGWTVFYGSPAVFLAMVLLGAIFSFGVIPREERQLEALFGEEYLRYKRSVRRWFGRY